MKKRNTIIKLSSIALILSLTLIPHSAHAKRKSVAEKMKENASELFKSVAPHVVDNKGKPVDGKKVMDKPYVLFYWSAHWCGPCRKELPVLLCFPKDTRRQKHQLLYFPKRSKDRKDQRPNRSCQQNQ